MGFCRDGNKQVLSGAIDVQRIVIVVWDGSTNIRIYVHIGKDGRKK